jgi:hypothetical protein
VSEYDELYEATAQLSPEGWGVLSDALADVAASRPEGSTYGQHISPVPCPTRLLAAALFCSARGRAQPLPSEQ